jgi:hypothetical protein
MKVDGMATNEIIKRTSKTISFVVVVVVVVVVASPINIWVDQQCLVQSQAND